MGNKHNSGILLPKNNNNKNALNSNINDHQDRKNCSLPTKKLWQNISSKPMSSSLSPLVLKRSNSLTDLGNVLCKEINVNNSKVISNFNNRAPKTSNNIKTLSICLNNEKEFEEEFDSSIYLDAQSKLTTPGNESLSLLEEIRLDLPNKFSSNDDCLGLDIQVKQVRINLLKFTFYLLCPFVYYYFKIILNVWFFF